MLRLAIAIVTLFAGGLAGAWAFNPDSGVVAHDETVWRICGIAVYVAVVLLPIALVTAFVLLVRRYGADRERAR